MGAAACGRWSHSVAFWPWLAAGSCGPQSKRSWHPACCSQAMMLEPGRRAVVMLLLLCVGAGCGSAVKQAAREAAPAAVKESVAQAQKPETRADIAEILADPRIRSAASELSEAVVEG